MQKKDFIKKRLGYLKCCIHTRHNAPLVQNKMNRLTRHVSVDGQIVIRSCAKGSLKYHKHQDTEHRSRSRSNNGKMVAKNLVATTVSSRIVGVRRGMEGITACCQDETKTHNEQEDGRVKGKGGGRQSFKHIDGDFPMCMKNENKDVELKLKKIERTRGEGGGRQRYRHCEGDVSMCMRNKGEENEARSKENEKSSTEQNVKVAAKR